MAVATGAMVAMVVGAVCKVMVEALEVMEESTVPQPSQGLAHSECPMTSHLDPM